MYYYRDMIHAGLISVFHSFRWEQENLVVGYDFLVLGLPEHPGARASVIVASHGACL